jgi:CRP-like cAMP-binding protein
MLRRKSQSSASPDTTQRWLIGAQVMALVASALGLQFVLNTTGGTLFAFSAAAPLLVLAATAVVLGVALYRFRRRHSLFEFRAFAPGEIIIREGDPGDCAYFIQEGEVEVIRNHGGSETVAARLKAGQYFGEMALLSNRPRNATVRAATPTRLALLGKQNFFLMLSSVPSAREDVLKTVQERAMRQAGQ